MADDDELADFDETPKPKNRFVVSPAERQTLRKNDALIEKKIQQYKKDFDMSTLTTVDYTQIRNMAALEVACAKLNQRLAGIETMSPQEMKVTTEAIKTMMAEHRQQATALGINRAKRVSEEESELDQYLPKLANEAYDFFKSRAIAIMCSDCRAEAPEVDIRMGWIVYHFTETDKEFEWSSTCARCKQPIRINRYNWKRCLLSELDKRRDQNVEAENAQYDDLEDKELTREELERELNEPDNPEIKLPTETE